MKAVAFLFALSAANAATVLLPDGQPAAGARATSLSSEHFVHVAGIEFQRPSDPVVVGEDGSLTVATETLGRWVILHADGWVDTWIGDDTPVVCLEPWHVVEGSVAAPLADGATVSYHRVERPRRPDEKGSVFWTSTAPVAADGTYAIRHVPSGHGSVGILREAKNERRILRWRDFPRMVSVPAGGPLHLSGGVTVSGRLAEGAAPAVITLAPKARPEATYHAQSDDSGAFEIPGVLPGLYRLSARPDDGSATRNVPQRDVEVETDPVDLGELAGPGPEIETDRRVEYSDGLIERIRAEADRHSDTPAESIWIGELTHPLGNYGARVTYRPAPAPDDPTTATQRMLLVEIPGEAFRKFYPENDSLGYGFRFSDGPFGKVSTFERALRVFPLLERTLHVPLEEAVEYRDALALLLAVETGSVRKPEPERRQTGPNTWSVTVRGFSDFPPERLPNIRSIRLHPDGTIRIDTREYPFGGRFYHFRKTDDGGYELVGGGGWVS